MKTRDPVRDSILAELEKQRVKHGVDPVATAPLTGGNKFDAGKDRFDLIPPIIEKLLAEVLTFGVTKYGPHNWAGAGPDGVPHPERGIAWSKLYAGLRRHLNAWWEGSEMVDPETGKSHLAHALCQLVFLATSEHYGIGTDDRFNWNASGDHEPVDLIAEDAGLPAVPRPAIEKDTFDEMMDRVHANLRAQRDAKLDFTTYHEAVRNLFRQTTVILNGRTVTFVDTKNVDLRQQDWASWDTDPPAPKCKGCGGTCSSLWDPPFCAKSCRERFASRFPITSLRCRYCWMPAKVDSEGYCSLKCVEDHRDAVIA